MAQYKDKLSNYKLKMYVLRIVDLLFGEADLTAQVCANLTASRLLPEGIVMDNLRCPNLDLLGFRLIEGYRRLGDVELDTVSPSDRIKAQLEMSSIEQEIRSHRENCFLCREIRWKKEMVRAFSNSEPVWRGTMAS